MLATAYRQLAKTYNALLGIAESNDLLERLGGEATVGQLLGVITDAGLEKHFGIRLLHKHNDILDSEIMLEVGVEDEEDFALVTRPDHPTESMAFVPNSWQLTAHGYVPSEFSHLELVSNQVLPSSQCNTLFCELASALRDCRAESVLGPCLNYSEYVESRRPRYDAKLLERTDSSTRANIVTFFKPDDLAFLNSSKTKWHAERVIDGNGKLTWVAACSCACTVDPEGDHLGTHTHLNE